MEIHYSVNQCNEEKGLLMVVIMEMVVIAILVASFFGNSANGSSCKVNWLKSKFEHLLQNLPTTGGHRPSLRKFSAKNENKVLGYLIDFS